MEEYPKFLLADPDNLDDYRIVTDADEEAAAGNDNYFWQGKAPRKSRKDAE